MGVAFLSIKACPRHHQAKIGQVNWVWAPEQSLEEVLAHGGAGVGRRNL